MIRSPRAVALLLLLSACRNEYAGVSSIEHEAEYQDPALLERAWGLPVAALGITLDELAAILRTEKAGSVEVVRDIDLERFRALLRTSNDPSRRLLVNFHRGPLFGRGGGHHSPIGGYLEDRDLVFVLDVNERYRPWLVRADRLFAAVDTMDGARKRGLLVVTPAAPPGSGR